MMAGIEGELKVFVSSARISQVSLPLRTTDLLFELLPWVKRAEDLVINCAIAQLSAEDGVATIDFFYLDSSQMRMVGGGTIDLRDEMLEAGSSPITSTCWSATDSLSLASPAPVRAKPPPLRMGCTRCSGRWACSCLPAAPQSILASAACKNTGHVRMLQSDDQCHST